MTNFILLITIIKEYESGDAMDFRQLETFVEVVKLKSFSKAAEKLYLTQPTVTNHIQNLENELGTLLLNRTERKITPTKAGNILYKYAIDILNIRDMACFNLGVYRGKIEGHLEISTSSIPKLYILPQLIKSFSEKFPNVTFSINNKDSKEVVKNILDGITDFGIIGAKYYSKHLEYVELIDDNIVLITPNNKKYPWENNQEINPKILLNERIILRELGSGTRHIVEKALKENDYSLNNLNIVACVEDNETIKKFTELGIGISFISEKAIEKEITNGALKKFRLKGINLTRKFYLIYHKNRQLSPLNLTFKEFILNYINKQNR